MGWVTKTVTGREIYEAIAKDGFNVLRGDWFSTDEQGKPRACLLGGAAINLGVYAHAHQEDEAAEGRKGIQEVLDREYVQDTKWLETIHLESSFVSISTAIINNFDKTIWNRSELIPGRQYEQVPGHVNAWYALTWDESLEMCKDLLTPVWDKSFTIDVFDYTTWDYVQKDTTDYDDFSDEPEDVYDDDEGLW